MAKIETIARSEARGFDPYHFGAFGASNPRKYKGVVDTIYNGMRPESSRVEAEAQLNGLIDRLRDNLPLKPSKKYVLAEFTVMMAVFRGIDTEDREQLIRYLEEIMDILGIESSDGLLNRWLYRPILGSNLEQQHKKL